jgi:carbamoyl-phosphate synthase large subunit
VPYVSKATGIPLAKIAARLMTGRKLKELLPAQLADPARPRNRHALLRQIARLPLVQVPRRRHRSRPRDEVHRRSHGRRRNFGEAFAKAQLSAGQVLPTSGTVFFSVNDHDKPQPSTSPAATSSWASRIVATEGTADVLEKSGLIVERVFKVKEGRPNVVDLIKGDRIQLIINTPRGQDTFFDEKAIRRAAVLARIPTITTIAAAQAAVEGIASMQRCAFSARKAFSTKMKP